MNEHYVVTLDRGHLRIYAERHDTGAVDTRLEVVEAMDFPADTHNPSDSGSVSPRMFSVFEANDQPLLLRREEQRRNTRVLARELNTFLLNRPTATWDFAAAPAVYDSVIDELSDETTHRLRRTLSKDLVNENAEEVRAHFDAPVI